MLPPSLQDGLKVDAHHIAESSIHISVHHRHEQDVANEFFAVGLRHILPDAVADHPGLLSGQRVEAGISVVDEAVHQLGFLGGFHRSRQLGDQPFKVPLRKIEQGGVLETLPKAAIDQVVDDHLRHAGANLLLQTGIASVEVQKHLVACDLGNSAGVVVVFCGGVQIALLEFRQIVEHDDVHSVSDRCIQGVFDLL